MCSIYGYKLKIQSLNTVIKKNRTKIATGLWVLLCHGRFFCEQYIKDLNSLKLSAQNQAGPLVPRSWSSGHQFLLLPKELSKLTDTPTQPRK